MALGRRTKSLSLAVAFGLAALLLYYSLRGIEWRQVAQIAAGASPGRLSLAVVLGTIALMLRAVRWRILLNAEGAVTIPAAFWATAAGYFGNNFLPARAGELVRTFMISAGSGLDTAYVLATALSERAADAVALVTIVVVVLLTLPAPPAWFAAAARPFAILALLGALGIALLPVLGPLGRTAILRAPFPDRLRAGLIATMQQGLRGMRAFHDARRLAGFVALTVVIWCVDALGVIVTADALGLRMSIPAAFLLIASLGLGSALPSTPGYVGIYQFVAVTVLGPFGFTRAEAIAYILAAQALSYSVIGIWGSLGLWRHRRSGPGPRPSTRSPDAVADLVRHP
jgi:glycosyltransferase 2 family protein